MSDNLKTNDTKDPFSAYFRQRLLNKPTPPDANCWDEIEARLPKKRAIYPIWIVLAIAASVIGTVFIVDNTMTNKRQPINNETLISDNNISDEKISDRETQVFQSTEVEIPVSTSIEEEQPISSQAESVDGEMKQTQKAAEEDIEDTAEDKNPEVEKNTAQVDTTEKVENMAEQTAQDEKGEKDYIPVSNDIDQLQYRSFENLMSYDKDRKHRSGKATKWLMLTGLGSSGGGIGYLLSSLSASSNDTDYKSPSFGDGTSSKPSFDGNGEGNNPPEEITKISHSIPVSFGVTVRKKINKTIGIETGLMYTYLSTDFKISGTDYRAASLKLHYIGIPVNLTVNLLDKKSWNIYLSGGGMVEKGLQSVYVKKGINSKDNNSIPGLQWSLNGGIGLSYNFYKSMNLYIEPGFAYYFDCNQPISRRTEYPFTFNFRTGIRYDF